MICSIHTLGINGIQGSPVVAECYISNGLPGFDIVGLPDVAVIILSIDPCISCTER